MQIQLRTHGLTPTQELLVHVHRRLAFALARFHPRVRTVRVLLADENGPRGGTDKRCRIDIVLAHRGRILVEHISSDVLAAVDSAAQRSARAVDRIVKRRIGRRRPRGFEDGAAFPAT